MRRTISSYIENMASPNFTYFDHDADIGIAGTGPTLDAAFIAAAEAMFGIMTDIGKISAKQCVELAFEESDPELAMVTWLNLLLAEAREHGMVFNRFTLTHQNGHWQGSAWGEAWHDGLERGTEVKGATLTMLSVKHSNECWEARCIVDI